MPHATADEVNRNQPAQRGPFFASILSALKGLSFSLLAILI